LKALQLGLILLDLALLFFLDLILSLELIPNQPSAYRTQGSANAGTKSGPSSCGSDNTSNRGAS
jgi:hypothetical protein